MKKPAGVVAGGLGVSDLCGRLAQAIAVRRHGYPMMVRMAVMVAKLHWFPHYGETRRDVKSSPSGTALKITPYPTHAARPPHLRRPAAAVPQARADTVDCAIRTVRMRASRTAPGLRCLRRKGAD